MDLETGAHVIKFSASWCGPCKTYSPIFKEASVSFTGAGVHEVDVDENLDLVSRFEIRGVPTTVFLKDGKVIHNAVGVKSKQDLVQLFESLGE